ncbi:hypothetical protein DL769_010767 [Monosporascus sp. CRB-8-3]|nr:hypothetical protein DL769_010767 [Monosporascus sp. CRB-8-3]
MPQIPGPYAAGVLLEQVPEWLLIGIGAAIIGARIYLRVKIQEASLSASDILMCLAWCAAVTNSSFDIVFARMGVLSPHINYYLVGWDGSDEEVEYFQKASNKGSLTRSFYLSKAALLVVYLQLFPNFMVKRRIVLWGTIVYCIMAYTATIFMTLFICTPIESNWSLNPDISCAHEKAANNFVAAWSMHFSSDIMIFFLPFLVINRLQMRRSLKISLYCTFLLGIINISFCLTRFITIHLTDLNGALSVSLIELWTALDANIAVIIACLPSLRPYFRSRLDNAYSYGNSDIRTHGSATTKSASKKANASSGFSVIDDEHPYAPPYTSSAQRHARITVGDRASAEDPWDDGKQSRGGSDIELVVRGKTNMSQV